MTAWTRTLARVTCTLMVASVSLTAVPTAHAAPLPGTAVQAVAGSAAQDGLEAQVLHLTNDARAHSRTCGGKKMKSVKPVRWNQTLASAANSHSADMATNNYFSHNSPGGASPFDRMRAAGYRYHAAGENIAAGQSLDPAAVVQAWLNSPAHCKVIMNGKYKELGIARVEGPGQYGVYWTQNFGAR